VESRVLMTEMEEKEEASRLSEVQIASQNGPLSPLTVLVPKEDGLYRISAYANVITPTTNIVAGTAHFVCSQFSWTDNVTTHGLSFPNSNVQGLGGGQFILDLTDPSAFASGSLFIQTKSSQPVTFATYNCGNGTITGNGLYNLYITAERLSGNE
jgi:hypothetical protein